MTKKYFQYSPLDTNIWVDRGANTVEDLELVLEIPEDIKFGETDVIIRIVNYDPFYKYEVSALLGQARIEDDLIYYSAPQEAILQDDTLTVDVTVDPRSIAYFNVGYSSRDYFYDQDGVFAYVDDYLNSGASEGLKRYLETLREEFEDLMSDADASVAPVTLMHYQYTSSNSLDGANFKIEEMFAGYQHLDRQWFNDGSLQGGIDDYHLPSDIDTTPNYESYLYQVKNGSYTFKSRNSNTGEAQGNTNDGYRFPGAIGSSLSVVNTGDKTRKSFDFPIPIGLYDLEAVLPPEILSLCITSIEITPILRGIPDGHTFLWEQISGDQSEVIWISDPTDKDLVITIGNIKTDRTFRFWISKGTKYEKRYDVVIYGTPKEELTGIPSAENQFSLMDTNLGLHYHETRPLLLTADRMWLKKIRVQYIDKIR